MKKTILLIGDRGLVGSTFKNLYKENYDFIGISSENKDQVFSISKKIDCIVFLAQSGEYKSSVLTADLFETNIKFLFECLEYYKGKVENLIFFSSGSVYKLNTGKIISEKTELNTEHPTPYIATKITAELIVKTYKDFFKSIVILRPFFIYGKQQRDNMLIATMHRNVLSGTPIKLSGPKGLVFNPIHAEDAANAIDHFIEHFESGIKCYNLAGPETSSLNDIVKILIEISGSKSIIEIAGNDDTFMVSDVNIPGWKASIGIREGLEKTVVKSVQE